MFKSDRTFVMIGSHVVIIVGSLLIGFGAESWCVGLGTYLIIVATSERIEKAITHRA
jgi:hypothetical protein